MMGRCSARICSAPSSTSGLHPFHVDLEQIDPRQVQAVEGNTRHVDKRLIRVVDRLPNELGSISSDCGSWPGDAL
jgi:hypothetical protein